MKKSRYMEWKRSLDIALSLMGLIFLSPFFLLFMLAIRLDSKGPVFFRQKRVGIHKKHFYILKFRTMRIDTPKDMPTHLLADPEQYITRIGKILRRTSLDELPQIINILKGDMSIIGPRPALWNQYDLIEERDKYGANDVMPGLTGWAQINGRDELEIPVKARLDGEYVKRMSFLFDVKCFFGTVLSVLKSDGVVEGGTGELHKNVLYADPNDADTIPAGYKKRILITGSGSYIGESVKKYLSRDPKHYSVDIISTIGLKPTADMFRSYDVVFNAAGIAHIKETNENRHLYYDINRDLSAAIAKAAKEGGVKQFILLSSMSVYGLITGHITKTSKPYPTNSYGESKLQADRIIEKLADENFKIAILRPPMVYGKGCKGNYQTLRTFALRSPVFPKYKNRRSMIYIGNLCEFVKRIIDREAFGLFFPQNAEYVDTGEMVKLVAKENGKKIIITSFFDFAIKRLPLNIVKKVFGNLTYEQIDTVSKYGFADSIRLTEGNKKI